MKTFSLAIIYSNRAKLGHYIMNEKQLEGVLEEIKCLEEPGDTIIIKRQRDMTEEDYEQIPEFQGF